MRQFLKVGLTPFRALQVAVGVLLLVALAKADRAFAQSPETAVVERVEAALSRGDANGFLADAAERVEIAVLGTSTLYSRAQATYVLEQFFREYPPFRFSADRPAATGGNFFVAGRYWYGSDDRFLNVYMRFRSREGAYEVRELRIERPAR